MFGVKYLIAFSLCAASCLPIVRGQQAKQRVTVADAISMTKVGSSPDDTTAKFSPDGQKFAVILRKGNLEHNTNDYSLLLWNTNQAFNGAKPEVLITLSSSSNRPAIKDIRWQDDGKEIAFLGEHPGELQQIYSVNISTHVLKKVTYSRTSIVSYTMSAHGEKILYAAEPSPTSFFEGKARREGSVVSTQTIYDVVTGHKNIRAAVLNGEVQFYLQTGEGAPAELHDRFLSPVKFHPPVMSPDGRHAVMFAIVDSIPASWNDYLAPGIQYWTQHRRTPPRSGERAYLLQTVLLNTLTGKIRPLLDAPTSTSSDTDVAWAPDSGSVVITNTYLPLNESDASERNTRLQTAFAAVEVKVSDGVIAKITEQQVNSPAWLSTNRLTFRAGEAESEGRTTRVTFEKHGRQWVKVAEESAEQTHPDIIQEEDLNEPPKIVLLDPNTGHRARLLDLNPQFAELQFAKEEAIKWRGSDGHDVKGGLYYPVEYERGRRYPLVVQTHAFKPAKFWIDGPFPTAFAAQPLAGKGIMVLQMEEDYSESDTPKEVDREVASLEGAIDYLDEQGLIDRGRVGVIGFSRTCLHLKFALTHSKYHLAAASVTDGVDNGYFQYILNSGIKGFEESFEGSNGGLPFGKSLESWIKRSPGFNVDKVSTPLLIFAPNPLSALFQWEWYAALKRLNKPVEIVVLEDGEHELQRPWDRRASLQGNVDWFEFWLKGEEDPDPAKAEQYVRWRELHSLNDQN